MRVLPGGSVPEGGDHPASYSLKPDTANHS
jgi:hypothetical protein